MNRFDSLESTDFPRATALIICERIIQDVNTNRKSVIDIFDMVIVPQLPVIVARMSIYAAIARGTKDISEFLLGLYTPLGEAIVRSLLNVSDWGNGHAEFALPVDGIPITSSGAYDLRLFFVYHGVDHVLSQRNFVVQIAPQAPEAQADSPTP